MGKLFNDPKYQVIDKAPGFWKTGTLCRTSRGWLEGEVFLFSVLVLSTVWLID